MLFAARTPRPARRGSTQRLNLFSGFADWLCAGRGRPGHDHGRGVRATRAGWKPALPRQAGSLSYYIFVFILLAATAFAEPRVSASLSSASVSVGESVDLEVTLSDTEAGSSPQAPQVDGFEFLGGNQGSQITMINGVVNRTATFTFRYAAKKEGAFTFPAIEVTSNGKKFTTQAVPIKVGPAMQAQAAGDFAFATIEPLKTTAYVGEDLPVEIRIFLDLSARWEWAKQPILTAEGFNVRELTQGQQSRQNLQGKEYGRVVFRTIATPSKAGKLSLGGATLDTQFMRAQQNPYGLLNRGGRVQEMKITAPAVELEVKPLPVDGRPAEFNGAIGEFTFGASGAPGKVNVGEPVTMTLTVRGQGNFDRVVQPPLADAAGWNAYDSEADFQAADPMKMSGTKTFRLPVAPLEPKTTMPVFAFAYFDPKQEKYVRLLSNGDPLSVIGSAAPKPADPAQPQQPVATTPEEKKADDILPNQPLAGAAGKPTAGLAPRVMFGAMLAPLPLLVLLALLRARKADPLAAVLAALRRERAEKAARVRASDDSAELLDAAVRVMQIDVALARRDAAANADESTILAAREFSDDERGAIRELLAARAELMFAGGGNERASAADRDRIQEALSIWERRAK